MPRSHTSHLPFTLANNVFHVLWNKLMFVGCNIVQDKMINVIISNAQFSALCLIVASILPSNDTSIIIYFVAIVCYVYTVITS